MRPLGWIFPPAYGYDWYNAILTDSTANPTLRVKGGGEFLMSGGTISAKPTGAVDSFEAISVTGSTLNILGGNITIDATDTTGTATAIAAANSSMTLSFFRGQIKAAAVQEARAIAADSVWMSIDDGNITATAGGIASAVAASNSQLTIKGVYTTFNTAGVIPFSVMLTESTINYVGSNVPIIMLMPGNEMFLSAEIETLLLREFPGANVVNFGTISNANGMWFGAHPDPEGTFVPPTHHTNAGPFAVTGSDSDWDWDDTYDILTINDGADVTITGNAFDLHRGRIEVNGNAEITLNGVSITGLGDNQAALMLNNGANLTLTLAEGSENTLESGRFRAGIQITDEPNKTLTINGTGSLTARGGMYSAGIGGGAADYFADAGAGGTLTINGGLLYVAAGRIGAGGGRGDSHGTTTVNGGNLVIDNPAVNIPGGVLCADEDDAWQAAVLGVDFDEYEEIRLDINDTA